MDDEGLDLQDIPSEEDDLDLDTASYQISTYGADYTLEILSKKIDEGEIVVPAFQRRYVWNEKKASKLIESFLLGLPVPQIFLYRQEKTENLMVVDGQQRLKTINYFLKGKFDDDSRFSLHSVKPGWEGKTYETLEESDRRRLKNSILRATVFQQIDPKDTSSVFEIFERLNTGGMALTLQEIRNCVITGTINVFLNELNDYPNWRTLLSKPAPDARMKDIEMILRFFALKKGWETYKKPMKDFISDFMRANKDINSKDKTQYSRDFKTTVDFILKNVGPRAFRFTGAINVAYFDALMVAISSIGVNKIKNIETGIASLKDNPAFIEAISTATTNDEKVQSRIKMAIQAFS